MQEYAKQGHNCLSSSGFDSQETASYNMGLKFPCALQYAQNSGQGWGYKLPSLNIRESHGAYFYLCCFILPNQVPAAPPPLKYPFLG